MDKIENEQINEEVREDLFKKLGTIFLVGLAVITPTMMIKDTFFNKEKVHTNNNILYKNGYIVEIKDDKKTLWRK